MKIRADEHVSPRIVRAIASIALCRGWELSHIAGTTTSGAGDEDWITAFAHAGGNGILSADRKMLKRETLLKAISDTGLVAVYLAAAWSSASRHFQAANLLFWWPKIEQVYRGGARGTIWVVPATFNPDHNLGRMQPLSGAEKHRRAIAGAPSAKPATVRD